jgi:anti-sigma factor ChrR (cupin superfamily)
MKAVKSGERLIANIDQSEFLPFVQENGDSEGSVLQHNKAHKPGVGFHIYKMEPGCQTTAHEHTCAEEFYVISGEVTDNDGTVYREGDLVYMEKGTQHSSYSEKGCVLAVYIESAEVNV